MRAALLCASSAEELFCIWGSEKPAGFSEPLFHGWGLPPQSLLRKASSPKGTPNSLSQNLTVLTAPSGREPLARPQTLRFSRKLYRYAKGPISEGAVAVGDWGSSGKYPFRLAASRQATFPKGTASVVAIKFLIALDTLALRPTACALSVIAARCHLSQRERQEHCQKLSHCA